MLSRATTILKLMRRGLEHSGYLKPRRAFGLKRFRGLSSGSPHEYIDITNLTSARATMLAGASI